MLCPLFAASTPQSTGRCVFDLCVLPPLSPPRSSPCDKDVNTWPRRNNAQLERICAAATAAPPANNLMLLVVVVVLLLLLLLPVLMLLLLVVVVVLLLLW